jgi:hypothetical protein
MDNELTDKLIASARHTIQTCRAAMTTNHPTLKQQQAAAAINDFDWLLSWYDYKRGCADANS